MDELTRTQDVTRTQPIDLPRRRRGSGETRSFRLLRTVVFFLAIAVGIAAVVAVTRSEDPALLNPSRLYSPTGHLPGEPSSERRVSMSWTAAQGAEGYWWGMVEDPARLPRAFIRPSASDRRVYFRFAGASYFVLRTAYRVDGRLRWTDELAYGPIVVRDQTGRVPPAPSIGPSTSATDPGGSGDGDASDFGGSGMSGAGGTADAEPVDPRFAGEPGGAGTGNGGPGGPGEPGSPAQEPGGGNSGPGSASMDAGQPGADGPSGASGPP